MWKNKQLKQRARKTLKANYIAIISLCFVLTFFGILVGSGTRMTSIETSDITWHHDPVPFAINDMNPKYTPGLVTYLNNFFAGSEETGQIAAKVMERFKDTSGVFYNIMYRVDKFIFTHNAAAKLVICIAITAYLAYYFLLKNVLQVGFSRFLMETRTYKKTKFSRVFFLFRKGGVMRSAAIMLLRTLLLTLFAVIAAVPIALSAVVFMLTEALWPVMVGAVLSVAGFILYASQHLSLCLVPYILAENPEMHRRDVFRLSKDMMKGNRLHALGLLLSFAGWELLSVVSVGVLGALYTTPYRYLSMAELYMVLRQEAIDSNIVNSAYLNDIYLTHPPRALLSSEGLTVSQDTQIFPVAYPQITPLKTSRLLQHVQDMDPVRHYRPVTLILFFFIFAFIGWCWEVGIHLVRDAEFINRGTMLGPWLPIYGVGGLLIIILLKRFAKRPAVIFTASMALCSIIEYITSWYLEKSIGLKYWDYSSYFLNINGRICLEGALVFALGGLVFVYIAAPMLDNMLSKVNHSHKLAVAIILVMLFGVDMTYSHLHPHQGKGITYGSENHRALLLELPDDGMYMTLYDSSVKFLC